MKVKITSLDGTPLPEYETDGAVAFDFRARELTTIPPKDLGLIPTGVIIEVPKGYMLHVGARSSTPKKKGLLMPHGMGIIDQDYCGPQDEIKLQYYNFSEEQCIVEKGERIGQGVFVKIDRAEWEKVDQITKISRGGFGSTGTH